MSYSFGLRAASKTALLALVAAKMDEIAAQQVCHERDKAPALAAAEAFVGQLTEDDTRDVSITMSGSLTGHWEGSDVTRVTGANVSVSAYLVDRPKPEADAAAT